MNNIDNPSALTERITPRLLMQLYEETNSEEQIIDMYSKLVMLSIDVYKKDHDEASLMNIMGLTKVLHNIMLSEHAKIIEKDKNIIVKQAEGTIQRQKQYPIKVVVGYRNNVKPKNFDQVYCCGKVLDVTVYDNSTRVDISYSTLYGVIKYQYPFLNKDISKEFPNNATHIIEALTSYFTTADYNTYIYDNKFYGPVVKGMALEGFAFTKVGVNGSPITGAIEHELFSTITRTVPLKMNSIKDGDYDAYEVTFKCPKTDGSYTIITNRYPKNEELINKYFQSTKEIVKAVIHYCEKIS